THISNELAQAALAGLEDVDVENLRPHYARTLWAWSDSLESQLEAARATLKPGLQGDKSLRAYRVYLAGCALGFEQGWIALHQVLFQHRATGRQDELDNPPDQAFPWRRDYIYK
ncbi:MAG: class I SAM-dependent methyltransferase, partial [Pusillimonas sp.]